MILVKEVVFNGAISQIFLKVRNKICYGVYDEVFRNTWDPINDYLLGQLIRKIAEKILEDRW